MKLDFEPDKWKHLKSHPREILKHIILGTLVGILLVCGIIFILFYDFNVVINEYKLCDWLSIILFQGIVAVAEELLLCGYLYEAVNTYFNKFLSVAIISFLFGFLHLFLHGGWMQFGVAILFSVIAIIIKEKYSLIAAIFAHFTYNICCKFLCEKVCFGKFL